MADKKLNKKLEAAYNYGKHRAGEVIEHVNQELAETDYSLDEKYHYWRGFEEVMDNA